MMIVPHHSLDYNEVSPVRKVTRLLWHYFKWSVESETEEV